MWYYIVKDKCLKYMTNELNETEGVEDLDMLLLVNGHLTAIMGGVCYDTWDCGRYRDQLMIVKEGEI